VTNKDFNKSYETAIKDSNMTVRPLIKSRKTRRAEAQQKGVTLDETNIKSFTFRNRYVKNLNHGRHTSTISNSV